MDSRPNVLFITLDQFRGDSMSCAGHPLVRTPNLDALAADGVRFARHYSQAAPCAAGRAALYTGTYTMTNRVVDNGAPLNDRFDNIALAGRRAGYEPALFGYTDQAIDPRHADPDDPRLLTYQGILPGFDVALELDDNCVPWMRWLNDLGYDVVDPDLTVATENERPAEHSLSAFLTDGLLRWIGEQDGPWFAHASYLRPHPPFVAAGEFATMYDPAECPPPLPIPERRHPIYDELLEERRNDVSDEIGLALLPSLQAQYFGMISEVDHQLGRVWEFLRTRGDWDNTLVVVTSDHGEQLGDQGLLGKLGFFESSYHILGIVRDPSPAAVRGAVVDRFTENVDILPTVCEAVGIPVPRQCDGYPLTPFLRGDEPEAWREAAHYEWDWSHRSRGSREFRWPWDRQPERDKLAVLRSSDRAYVQFGDGSWRCFDLATDPTWQTEIDDPTTVLADAQAMLAWRSEHLERTLERPVRSA